MQKLFRRSCLVVCLAVVGAGCSSGGSSGGGGGTGKGGGGAATGGGSATGGGAATGGGTGTGGGSGCATIDTTYQTCSDCVYYSEGCDNMGNNCAHDYFATGGTYNITTLTLGSTDGGNEFKGTGNNLHFVEWDFGQGADHAIDGGRCVNVTAFAFDSKF